MAVKQKIDRKVVKDQILKVIGKVACRDFSAGTMSALDLQGAYGIKFLKELDSLAQNPYQGVAEAEEKVYLEGLLDLPLSIMEWAGQAGYGYREPKEGELKFKLEKTFGLPQQGFSRADTHEMLQAFGIPRNQTTGVYDITGMKVDLEGHRINGNPLMGSGAFINAFHHVVAADAETLMHVIVGLMLRSMLTLIPGAIREQVIDRIESAFDTESLGYADPLRQAFNRSKIALLPLSFDGMGFTLGTIELATAETYSVVKQHLANTGAHSQGKYMVPFDAAGIRRLRPKGGRPLASLQQAVPGVGQSSVVPLLVGSTDTAKWFKRLLVGNMEQCHLVAEPDTGYCRIEGHTQTGRRTPVLVVKGGIALPYLGSGVCLASRKVVGEHIAHYLEQVFSGTVPGTHEDLQVPPTGTLVTKGSTLIDLPGAPIVADRDGKVIRSSVITVNGETRAVVILGTEDRTGQAKARSMGGVKVSFTYLDYTGLAAEREFICAALELGDPSAAYGDVMVFGLRKDDPTPLVVLDQDGLKATGKGASVGAKQLAAETLQQHIDYNVQADHEGSFNGLMEEFEATSSRKVTVVHSVDRERFAQVRVARDKGITAPGLELFELRTTSKTFYIVKQEADAYIAYDLLKVESIPVANASTKQRVPGEVALAASTLLPKTAGILVGGKDQRSEYVALWKSFDAQFQINPENPGRVYATYISGPSEELPVINVDVEQHPNVLAMLRDLSADPEKVLGWTKKFVIGRFNEDGSSNLPGGGAQAVLFDPQVVKAFGSGEDKSSLMSLLRALFNAVANKNLFAKERERDYALTRAIRRVRGTMKAAATSSKVAKRVIRGLKAIQTRTRCGYIPSGWLAVGYRSNTVRNIALLHGWNKSMEMSPGEYVSRNQVVGILFRAPQNTVTPQRVFCPDAPDFIRQAAFEAGNFPEAHLNYRSDSLEPDVMYISAEATAADNGDHDGDGRCFCPITDAEAVQELLAYDWRKFRRSIHLWYKADKLDPVVASVEYDAKKTKWGSVKEVPQGELTSLTYRSIVNQTLHIGIAYNHAHAALVNADIVSTSDSCTKAQALMQGHYEEQLAGLSDAYHAFYTNLGQAQALKEEWYPTLEALNTKIAHSKQDLDFFLGEIHPLVSGYGFLGAQFNKGNHGDSLIHGSFYEADGSLNLKRFANCILVGAYRMLSKGALGSPILRFLFSGDPQDQHYVSQVIPEMRAQAAKGSIAAKQVLSYLAEVLPHVDLDKFAGVVYQDYID
jgi:hypothetical protein